MGLFGHGMGDFYAEQAREAKVSPPAKRPPNPAIFGKVLVNAEAVSDEVFAWKTSFGDSGIRIRVALLSSGSWHASVRFSGELLTQVGGDRSRTILLVERYLKSLKRALVGVP